MGDVNTPHDCVGGGWKDVLAPPTLHGDRRRLENFSALSLRTSTTVVTSAKCVLSRNARRWKRAMFPQPMKAKRTAAI